MTESKQIRGFTRFIAKSVVLCSCMVHDRTETGDRIGGRIQPGESYYKKLDRGVYGDPVCEACARAWR